AVAAYAGLRRGEIEGLDWKDWHGSALWIARSRWGKYLLEPKTQASAAPVPVISSLVEVLTNYRAYLGNPACGPMFPGARCGKPVSMANVANRAIKPALKAAGLSWHGWHAFRRGLATNLNSLGVSD